MRSHGSGAAVEPGGMTCPRQVPGSCTRRRGRRPDRGGGRRAIRVDGGSPRALLRGDGRGFWAAPHECDDGATVQGTLLVSSTRDFESPDIDDPDPTVRVQFLAVCPDGTSFSWGAECRRRSRARPTSRASVAGSGIARDNLGGTHQVSFDVVWSGVGRWRRRSTAREARGRSERRQRQVRSASTAHVLVDGEADHPTRPAPFIRVDTEK